MTPTTNTAQGLLSDIIEHPEADDLRLIYADWLEDHGGEEGEARAEFIRSQVELATKPECNTVGMHCDSCEKLKRIERYWCETNRLSLQEKLSHFDVGLWRQKEEAVYHPIALFRRGFVAELHAPLAVLQQHLPALVQEHPIERVRATDREPYHLFASIFSWWNGDYNGRNSQRIELCWLPQEVFLFLEGGCRPIGYPNARDYPTAEVAHDALSVALLTLARR